jgi:hypothetical protein
LRARITCLTLPSVVTEKLPAFNGRVNWLGFSCFTTYEISAAGPFMHRRILFKSPLPWPGQRIVPGGADTTGGVGTGEFVRAISTDLSDGKLAGCLRRLFQQPTVRGVVQGPTSTLGVTVLRDETRNLRGVDDGTRSVKKYWDSLRGEPVMQYNLLHDGSFDISLANSPSSQQLYLLDVYSYGLEGLDCALPDPTTQAAGARFGQTEGASSQVPETMKMFDDVKVEKKTCRSPLNEDMEAGTANISCTLKLYFRQA